MLRRVHAVHPAFDQNVPRVRRFPRAVAYTFEAVEERYEPKIKSPWASLTI